MFKSKVYRLFCFLFAFSLVFALFGVEVSAASDTENLVDGNLANWESLRSYDSNFNQFTVTSYSDGKVYRLSTFNNGNADLHTGIRFIRCVLEPGFNYNLSFHLPSLDEINSAISSSQTLEKIETQFQQCSFSFGIGYITASGSFEFLDDLVLLTLDGSNYYSHLGNTFSASFKMPDVSGTPFVYIKANYLEGTTSHYFYLSNFSVTAAQNDVQEDNTDNDDIIKGSENLIDDDLRNWHIMDNTAQVSKINDSYCVRVNPVYSSSSDIAVRLFNLYSLSDFVAGNSYTFSFHLEDLEEVNSSHNMSFNNTLFYSQFYEYNGQLFAGLGSYSSSTNTMTPIDGCVIEINTDNYLDYYGTDIKISFELSNVVNPCLFFYYADVRDFQTDTPVYFYFSDISLIDNSKEKEDGMLSKIFEWFQKRFDSIGESFSNLGDKLSDVKNNIVSKFTELKESLSDSFSNLGDRISGFFTDLKTNMSNWFSELGNKITTKFQEIGDKFSEFFDKFKPRVYFNFRWFTNKYINNHGNVSSGSEYEGFSVVTDFFEVPSGSTYLANYIKPGSGFTLQIFQYDIDEHFLNVYSFNESFEEFELTPSRKYRFQISGPDDTDFTAFDNLSDICNDILFVYADEGWLNAFLFNIKMGIKDLFVPDEAFITEWKGEVEELLQERLGIIWDAGDFFITLIQTIGDLLTTSADDIYYELPEMVIELNGKTYTLWQAQQVDFSFLEKNAFFAMLYKLYKAVLNVCLAIPLLNYAKKEMDATLHN